MRDVTAAVAKQSSQKQQGTLESSQKKALQHYYGQIGIPAVAAAVRYQGYSKNPAYAPVAIECYRRHGLAT